MLGALKYAAEIAVFKMFYVMRIHRSQIEQFVQYEFDAPEAGNATCGAVRIVLPEAVGLKAM